MHLKPLFSRTLQVIKALNGSIGTPLDRAKMRVVLPLLLSWLTLSSALASYPADPISDIKWPHSSAATVDVIESWFNRARIQENKQLSTSVPSLKLPSQREWDGKSTNEKALWLINRERLDRGVPPLHGVEVNVTTVAQQYADYLMSHNAFSHTADGRTPWERLNRNTAIGGCHDFLNIAENIGILRGGWTLPLERILFMWMYSDKRSGWGHRHAILWYPYNDNGGARGKEGFLGIGRARGTHNGWPKSELFVMDVFDPCSNWNYE